MKRDQVFGMINLWHCKYVVFVLFAIKHSVHLSYEMSHPNVYYSWAIVYTRPQSELPLCQGFQMFAQACNLFIDHCGALFERFLIQSYVDRSLTRNRTDRRKLVANMMWEELLNIWSILSYLNALIQQWVQCGAKIQLFWLWDFSVPVSGNVCDVENQ